MSVFLRCILNSVVLLFFPREKYKLKEREEMWHKIEDLAKQNPQVNTLPASNQKFKIVYFFYKKILLFRLGV